MKQSGRRSRVRDDEALPPDLMGDAAQKNAAVALREQLTEFGDLLALQPQRRKRPTLTNTQAVEVLKPLPSYHRVLSAMLVSIAVILTLVVGVGELWPRAPVVVPDELIGEWTTDDPRYAGRMMAFAESEIVVGLTPGVPPASYVIRTLDATLRGDTTLLTLQYDVDTAPVELHTTFIRSGVPRLVFERPAGLVWTRHIRVAGP
jgi:hypothetical protein